MKGLFKKKCNCVYATEDTCFRKWKLRQQTSPKTTELFSTCEIFSVTLQHGLLLNAKFGLLV